MLFNCNAISTTSSLKEVIASGLLVMLAPLITGARTVHMSDYSFSPIVRSLHILVRVDLRHILRGVCSLWSSHGSHSLWCADGDQYEQHWRYRTYRALFACNEGVYFPSNSVLCSVLGAWDNAKKYIGGGAFGGKGSDDYKAAVVGRVGDVLLIPYSSFSYSFLPLLLRRGHSGGSHEGRIS